MNYGQSLLEKPLGTLSNYKGEFLKLSLLTDSNEPSDVAYSGLQVSLLIYGFSNEVALPSH